MTDEQIQLLSLREELRLLRIQFDHELEILRRSMDRRVTRVELALDQDPNPYTVVEDQVCS